MSELALPRPRSRRKKIKPPHPFWWFAVAACLMSMFGLYRDLRELPAPWAFAWLIADGCLLLFWWPRTRCLYSPVATRPRDVLLLKVAFGFMLLATSLALLG